jgi:hypothetical protein
MVDGPLEERNEEQRKEMLEEGSKEANKKMPFEMEVEKPTSNDSQTNIEKNDGNVVEKERQASG